MVWVWFNVRFFCGMYFARENHKFLGLGSIGLEKNYFERNLGNYFELLTLLIFSLWIQVTIDCRKIRSITREKTAYVVPNAILITTNDEKVKYILGWKHQKIEIMAIIISFLHGFPFHFQHFLSSFLSRETVYKLLIKVWEEVLEIPQVSISKCCFVSVILMIC